MPLPSPGHFPIVALARTFLEQDNITAARRVIELATSDSTTTPAISALYRALAAPRVVGAAPAADGDRSLEYRWLELHADRYPGRWVALLRDQLLADAPTLKSLLEQVRAARTESRPMIHRID